jgi:hypothetical protein
MRSSQGFRLADKDWDHPFSIAKGEVEVQRTGRFAQEVTSQVAAPCVVHVF